MKKGWIYFVICLFVIWYFVDDEKVNDSNNSSQQEQTENKPSVDKNKYKNQIEDLYAKFYKKYSPVECLTNDYKGYTFLHCHIAGTDSVGGIYVIDDMHPNADNSFNIYAVNGKAISQREAIINNYGKDIPAFKELPLPHPSWVDIQEINTLFSNGEKYKGIFTKESLLPEKQKQEPVSNVLTDDEKKYLASEKISKEVAKLTTLYFNAVGPAYKEYLKECLNGNLPNMANMKNATCTFADRYENIYDNFKDYIIQEKYYGDTLNQNYNRAFELNAGDIRNAEIGTPHIFNQIKDNLKFTEYWYGYQVVSGKDDYNIKSLYSVSNFKQVYNQLKPDYFTIMHDNALFIKCDVKDRNNPTPCKIVPLS